MDITHFNKIKQDQLQTAEVLPFRLSGGQQQLATSYQAFTKVLRRWTDELVMLMQAALRGRMQAVLSGHWRLAGFILFGVDGSRVELPRTRSHE